MRVRRTVLRGCVSQLRQKRDLTYKQQQRRDVTPLFFAARSSVVQDDQNIIGNFVKTNTS